MDTITKENTPTSEPLRVRRELFDALLNYVNAVTKHKYTYSIFYPSTGGITMHIMRDEVIIHSQFISSAGDWTRVGLEITLFNQVLSSLVHGGLIKMWETAVEIEEHAATVNNKVDEKGK